MATNKTFVVKNGLSVGNDLVVDASGKIVAQSLSNITTDNISQGSSNLYYSDAQVDAHLSGTSPISYSSGTISLDTNSISPEYLVSSGTEISGTLPFVNETADGFVWREVNTSDIEYQVSGFAPEEIWTYDSSDDIQDIAISGDNLYIARNKTSGTNQFIQKINASDGTLIWSYNVPVTAPTDGPVWRVATDPDNPDHVYYVLGDTFNLSIGKIIGDPAGTGPEWDYYNSSFGIVTDIEFYNGTLYLSTTNNTESNVVKIDASDGTFIGSFQIIPDDVVRDIEISDVEDVYASFQGGTYKKFDSSGNPQWTYDSGKSGTSIEYHRGIVYAIVYDTTNEIFQLLRINSSDGSLISTTDFPDDVNALSQAYWMDIDKLGNVFAGATYDVFPSGEYVLKFDANGNYLDRHKTTHSATSQIRTVKVDNKGNFYTVATDDFVIKARYANPLDFYVVNESVDKYLTGGTGVTYTDGVISIGQDVAPTADVTFNTLDLTSDLTVGGNVSINGTQVILNADYTGSAPTEDVSITVNRGTESDKSLTWDETSDKWTFGSDTVVASTFEGNLTGNADTASQWVVGRDLSLAGDLSGTVTLDGSANETLTASITASPTIALTGDATGSASITNFSGTTTISATVTGGNADTLNYQSPSFYLDYNNFTNTPMIGDGELTIEGRSGLTGVGTFSANTGLNTTISLDHADTSSAESVDNSGGNVIQDITLDAFGHITALGSVDLDTRYYTESEADSLFVNVSGDTMTGTLTLAGDPTTDLQAATKRYVDQIAEGLNVKPSDYVGTTTNLSATYSTSNNTLTATAPGALSIDNESPTTGQTVLVKDQNNAYENGSYVVTAAGDASNPWVLTRVDEMDETSEIPGAFEFVVAGSTNASTGWVATVPSDFALNDTSATVDPDFTTKGDIVWNQFSGAGVYTAGTGLTLDGNVFNNTGVLSVDGNNGNITPAQLVTAVNKADGTGSGLDADLLDGQEGSYYLDFNNFTNVPSSTNYGSSDFDTDFSNKTTDDLTEGTSNLYYSDSLVDAHLSGGGGIDYSGGVISHSDTSTVSNLSVNNSGATFIQDISLSFDTYGHVTGATATSGTFTSPNGYSSVEVIDVDSGYSWSNTGTAVADSSTDTIRFISGNALNVDVDTTNDAIRFSVPSNAIGSDELNVAGSGSNTQFLRSDGDGSFTWATPPDTQPNNASITVSGGSGLSGTGTFTTNQGTNETVTLAHGDTSSAGSVNNSGNTFIQDITIDSFGHITAIGSSTATIPSAPNDATITLSAGNALTGGGNFTTDQSFNEIISLAVASDGIGADELNVTGSGTTSQYLRSDGDGSFTWSTPPDTQPNNASITISAGGGMTGGGTFSTNQSFNESISVSHADTSSQGSINNSGNTVIQDISLDTYGHITSIGSTTLSIPSAANNATITISAGAGLSGGGNFTTDQSSNETINLAVADNSIGSDQLDVSGTGTTGQVLTSAGDGSFTWEDAATGSGGGTTTGTTAGKSLAFNLVFN